MRDASAALIGRADFGAFAIGEGGTRTVRKAEWTREGELLRFEIEADAFLRGMVRAIVGTLLWVGRGKIGVERFGEIVRSKDRAQAGPSAPARGLCLTGVAYENGRPRREENDQHHDEDEEREDE
jgi:tRNA pseudouridine38-40 synthase